MKIILGSQSPRRKEIMEFFKLPFEQVVSGFDEESVVFEGNPEEYALKISKGKSDALYHLHPEDVVVTADTIVHKDQVLYGKPIDRKQAYNYLNQLQGTWHQVFTAVSLRYKDQYYDEVSKTNVLFNPLTHEQIEKFLNRVDFSDKAGGYMIEKGGAIIVNKLDGCFYNVIGLPVNSLCRLFSKVGIDLWDHF